MRTRTAAASAVLVLFTLLGSAACSVSSEEDKSSSGSSASVEKAADQRQAARAKPGIDPSECATSADKMPKGCEVDVSVGEIDEASPAAEAPSMK